MSTKQPVTNLEDIEAYCAARTENWTSAERFVRHAIVDLPALVREVRALRAYVGLVVQYMEKGEPYWYGDVGLKDQGRALLP